MLLRDRMLGGVSPLALFNAEGGAGSGGAAGAGAGGAGGAGGTGGAGGARQDGGGGAGGGAQGGGAQGAAGAGGGGSGEGGGAAGGGAGGAGGAAGGTLAGRGGEGGGAATPAGFGDKWREELAGEDKDALTDLAKYTDPKAVYKSLRDLQGKLSKGELKAPATPFPKDGNAEAQGAWRKANGLPEAPAGYVEKLALPEGVVIGEADKPLVESFAKSMFEAGATQGEMDRAVSWFYQQQVEVAAAREEADGQARINSEVALKGEWSGGDYRANMNAMGAVLSLIGEGPANAILGARGEDGQLLGNNPAVIKVLAQLGRELNPAATIVPPGANQTQAIADEIKSIEAVMGKATTGDAEARRAYYGVDGQPGLEARYRELIDAQQKMGARGKAA